MKKEKIDKLLDDALERCLYIDCDDCPLGVLVADDEPMIECSYRLTDLIKRCTK